MHPPVQPTQLSSGQYKQSFRTQYLNLLADLIEFPERRDSIQQKIKNRLSYIPR